jgi:hypothetical protein
VGARYVAFRANAAELAARGVQPWAVIDALGELPQRLQELLDGQEPQP